MAAKHADKNMVNDLLRPTGRCAADAIPHYLNATGMQVYLLLDFGNPRLGIIKRGAHGR